MSKAPDSPNLPSIEELERKKLALEIGALSTPFLRRPNFWLAAIPLCFAIPGLATQWIAWKFDVREKQIQLESADTEIKLTQLELLDEKKKLAEAKRSQAIVEDALAEARVRLERMTQEMQAAGRIAKQGGRLMFNTSEVPQVVGVVFITKADGKTKIDDQDLHDAVFDLKILADTNLKNLNLQNSAISDDGLDSIRDLTSLHRLDLRGTQVTDAGLVKLRELKELKVLFLNDSQVTNEGIADLKEYIPDATITH